MDLNRIGIKLRSRSGYASMDVGTLMVQRNWRLLFSLGFVFSFPVFLLLIILFPSQPFLAALITWWLKPLWERPLLLVLSRDLFNQQLNFKQACKQSLKLLHKQSIQSLTLRRFSPTRSFDAPVTQLEQLQGIPRRDRLSALHSRNPGSITTMTIVYMHIEGFLLTGFMAFSIMFFPDNSISFEMFIETFVDSTGANLLNVLYALCWYAAMLLIAPFYVASGFFCYLNQRSLLEAWDLELTFRQLANKHRPKKFNYGGIVAALLLSTCLLVPNQASFASESDPYIQEKQAAKKEIQKITQGPDFTRTESQTVFRSHNPAKEYELEESEDLDINPTAVAGIAKFLAWTSIILVCGFLLYKLLQFFDVLTRSYQDKSRSSKQVSKPEQLFGLDLNTQTLPDNIYDESLALWQSGEHRAALSLLYRASLSSLIHQHQCSFEDGYTELECSLIVRQEQASLAPYFGQLTSYWRTLAYGHKLPSKQEFEQLATDWQQTFSPKQSINEGEVHG